MDGNGRWAKARGLPRSEGHKAGVEAAKAIITRCRELGIGHLTLYSFSKENWGRPKDEISFLFDLLMRFLKDELKSLLDQSIKLQVLGEPKDLPFAVRQALGHVVKKTAKGTGMILNLALNYSGRDEIVRAAQEMLRQGLAPEELDEERFSDYLYTAGQPDPDFIIRTSGEIRLSNYLLYQAAYSELYFTPVPWPDFSPDELDRALAEFAARQRRFGLTGEQVKEDRGE
jgi:undecaprenyl diphosphate synthase